MPDANLNSKSLKMERSERAVSDNDREKNREATGDSGDLVRNIEFEV